MSHQSALPDCGDSFDSDSTYEQSHNSWFIAVHFNADRGVELWHQVSNVIYYHLLSFFIRRLCRRRLMCGMCGQFWF